MSGMSTGEALELLECRGPELYELFARAGKARHEHRGSEVVTCSIINAKSGGCPEDCTFCAQSAHSQAKIERYPLVSANTMLVAAQQAAGHQAARFGIVTSGKAVTDPKEIDSIAAAIGSISRSLPVEPCASLGVVDGKVLSRLLEAGLTRYHHNLETAESFFKQVCTTRRYLESVDTLLAAKEIGLSVCAGGIFGLGESHKQRIELLAALRDLCVDSVPLNFIHPIPGTRLADMDELTPLDCLKVIAVARLMMPDSEIRVCGGREHNLREFQSWIFMAGADGLMVGGYLTTPGRNVSLDLQMITESGMKLSEYPEHARSLD